MMVMEFIYFFLNLFPTFVRNIIVVANNIQLTKDKSSDV